MTKTKDKPTMQDIAEELGVSRLTVSSVVNGKCKERNISEKTIERIESYLKQRGFVPSSHALALKNKNICTTGILCSGKLYSHLTEAFNQFTNYFIGHEQRVEIVFTKHDQVNFSLKNLISRGISQLIWIHSNKPNVEFQQKEETLALLKHVKTTIYNYNAENDWDKLLLDQNIRLVGINRKKSFKDFVNYISDLNHKNIFLLDSDQYFVEAFKEAGLNIFLYQGESEDNLNNLAMSIAKELKLLIRNKKITMACFKDDELAGYVMHQLRMADILIPQDISITGFDGMPFSECYEPPLTTLKVPVNEMVQFVLSDLPINNKEKLLQLFECQLIKRKSNRKI